MKWANCRGNIIHLLFVLIITIPFTMVLHKCSKNPTILINNGSSIENIFSPTSGTYYLVYKEHKIIENGEIITKHNILYDQQFFTTFTLARSAIANDTDLPYGDFDIMTATFTNNVLELTDSVIINKENTHDNQGL